MSSNKQAKNGKSGKTKKPRRGRKGYIEDFPIAELLREIAKRRKRGEVLMRRREHYLKKLREIEDKLTASGGSPEEGADPGRRRRATNDIKLEDALHKLLEGKTLSVGEAAEQLLATGFKTHSQNFKIMVNMTLTKYPKKFKRVSRGHYTAR